jgi:hypothetical protein
MPSRPSKAWLAVSVKGLAVSIGGLLLLCCCVAILMVSSCTLGH